MERLENRAEAERGRRPLDELLDELDNRQLESLVRDECRRWRELKMQVKVLGSYSIGAGMTVSRLNQEDQLQDLHRRLKGMPSYMYLNAREQKLETIANAYLDPDKHPVGTKAQLAAIPTRGNDLEDDRLLRELRGKLEKVIEARAGRIGDYDAVLERMAKLQRLQAELEQLEETMRLAEEQQEGYGSLIRLYYVEKRTAEACAMALCISRPTFFRWKPQAARLFLRILEWQRDG
ncbi:RNA polymerase subunit sigma-24 [Paenibacillus sp. FSL W8-1187]|uniref:Uncharacterized protein n=1 Tax=Paenibacillus pasadenensis TaxID=217090 RepID=A0A2N5N9S6_9BACL|nr:RNA polymerase subunit sigma-24 [Paenibacillus pasadenensis]PLT47082.1 hypothetical protein B8V81_1306 [Paenibacillus pasadenensis]